MITTAAGGGTFLLTNLTDEPQTWALLLSLLIGGITLLVQFLVDLENRQRVVEDHIGDLERAQSESVGQIRKALTHEIAKVGAATALYDRLGRSPMRAEPIAKLVRLTADLSDEEETLAHRVARIELESLTGFLEQLSHRSEITYQGEDRDWLLALTQQCKRSISAISRGWLSEDGSRFVDQDFWASELSHRYVELQQVAIVRGVVVRRLFVLDRADLVENPDLRLICDQQRALGIVIRTLDASSLTSWQRSMLPDLILFDDEISYELNAGPGVRRGPTSYFIKTSLVVQSHLVGQRVQQFADLWDLGLDY